MKQILVEYKCGVPVPKQMSEAIREIQTNKYRNVLIHIFSGVPDEDMLVHLCQELRDCCSTDLIVGTMSAGEIMDGHMIRQGVLISVILFEEADIKILRYDNVKENEVQIGISLREVLDAMPDLKAAELLFPGTEIDTEFMYDEISRCRKHIQIFGRYPGG
ncbi:MAG: hypothetical protein J6Y90_05960, partial [Lachnospiraceae bacterium]|nr:hypothetical protein [Lachnospiraceae bacterium]